MNFSQTIPLADGWGMHGGSGWWMVGAALMMLCMGAMMWMMMRGMGGGSSQGSPEPRETRGTTESPMEILERRFAEGAISIEDYRARREVLVNGSAEARGAHEDEVLTASRAGEGDTR